MSDCRTLEDIGQSKELFSLHLFAEDNAAGSPGGVSGDLSTAAVHGIRIPEQQKK